jgi:hypothetical protein
MFRGKQRFVLLHLVIFYRGNLFFFIEDTLDKFVEKNTLQGLLIVVIADEISDEEPIDRMVPSSTWIEKIWTRNTRKSQ